MDETQPLFYRTLLRLHVVITRGLKVIQENSQSFSQTGFPDDAIRAGFIDYAQSLLVTIHLHFQTEESLSFPYTHNKLPGLRLEPLVAQHKQIIPYLVEMQAIIEKINAATQPIDLFGQLDQVSSTLRVLWRLHSNAEEGYFASDSISARGLTEEEQVEITRQTSDYNQKHMAQPGKILPFILFNLPIEQRAEMERVIPEIVIRQLIPGIWKDEWAPMKPFFLD
jgi:hypothetical protein